VEGDHRFYHAVLGAHRCQAVTPSDLATALAALDARVTILGDEGRSRNLSIEELYVGPGESDLRAVEIVTSVELPAEARHRRAVFEKVRLWHGDFAVVSVCVSGLGATDATRLDDARVVFGALGPTPWRARATERALATGADASRALRVELGSVAHPLRENGWKLDAAAGLFDRALEGLITRR
jgi:CO/xanthine dehydrogenase FAD-binding subunit